MNGLALIVSVIAALAEFGISYQLMHSFGTSLPLPVQTAIVFAVGMLFVFLTIIIVGATAPQLKAADFVRNHFGRTLALMLMSVILLGGLGFGGEAVYQIQPDTNEPKVMNPDVLFLVDESASMGGLFNDSSINMFSPLCDELETILQGLAKDYPGTNVSILSFGGDVVKRQTWAEVTTNNYKSMVDIVRNNYRNTLETSFYAALEAAYKSIVDRTQVDRNTIVIMLSDGQAGGESFYKDAMNLLINDGIKIYGVFMGTGNSGDLANVCNKTGGKLWEARQISDFGVIKDAVDNAILIESVPVTTNAPDTLLTERERTTGIMNLTVLRILLLAIIGFVFKLIAVISIGRNKNNSASHVLHALVTAVLSALVIEFGYTLLPPSLHSIPLAVYWILMMTQLISTKDAIKTTDVESMDFSDVSSNW
jgi:hypothetical protein